MISGPQILMSISNYVYKTNMHKLLKRTKTFIKSLFFSMSLVNWPIFVMVYTRIYSRWQITSKLDEAWKINRNLRLQQTLTDRFEAFFSVCKHLRDLFGFFIFYKKMFFNFCEEKAQLLFPVKLSAAEPVPAQDGGFCDTSASPGGQHLVTTRRCSRYSWPPVV